MMFNEGPNLQHGAGTGSLFSGLFREIMPVSKSAIKKLSEVVEEKTLKTIGKTLKKEANKEAVNSALELLNKKQPNKLAKQNSKKATKKVLPALKQKQKYPLSQPKKNHRDNRKRSLSETNKYRKKRKPLIADDF